MLEEFSAATAISGAQPQPSPFASAPALTPPPNTNENHEQVGEEGGRGSDGGSGGGASTTAAGDDEFARELEAGMADLLGELEDSVSVGFTLPFPFSHFPSLTTKGL